MAITKVTRTLLSTGIVDNSNATAITIDSSENTTFSGSILSNIAGNNSTGGNIRIGLVSDDAAKYNAITSTQYDSGTETEGFTLISAHSTDASTNNINIGGSFGEQNSATSIRLYTAANATTRTGSERMRIDSSGNVGIGTTSPNAPLEVNGGTTMTGGWGRSLLLRHPFPMMVFQGEYSTDTYAGIGYDNTSGMQFMVNSPTIDLFANSQSAAMVIDNSKNVGIGTSSPSQVLSLEASDTTVRFMEAKNSAGSMLVGVNGSGNAFVSGQTSGKPLILETNNTERMRINSSGCVGIGSTVDRSIGTNITTTVINGSVGGGLWLSGSDSSATTSQIYSFVNGSVGRLILNQGTGVGGGDIHFTFNESATPTMTLQSNGNVLIGDITSDFITYGKLQVAGGGYTAGWGGIVGFFDTDGSVGSSNLIQLLSFSGDTDATGGQFIRFRDSNSVMGSVSAANGTQVSYGVSSDERLKENIVDASSQLDVINNIQVREFDWKVNGYHEVGMIAQELNTVVPSVVQEGGDDITEQPWSVDYGKLTPFLVKAIQEQQTIIDNLKTRIETLENA